MGAYDFIRVNWSDLWIAASSVVTAASIIVKLTPNKWDDSIIARVMQFLAMNKPTSDPKMDPK